jgi:2-iminobutanoate/2-iminopropanoate deaminase
VRRTSITVPGIDHEDQHVPAAVTITGAIGGLLVTGGICGRDPETGEVPKKAADEVAQTFANLRAVLDAADCPPESVAKITIFTTDRSILEHVNREWVAMFPDPESRPARHTLVQQLAGMRLQLDCLAVLRTGA